MNRREKKRLRKKYLQTIDNCLFSAKRELHSDESNFKLVSYIEQLKEIVENTDFTSFYHGREKRLWPSKYILQSHRYTDRLESCLSIIKDDLIINRDSSINNLLKGL